MKPASLTPLGALIIGEVLAECDVLPEGAFSILPATSRRGRPVHHRRAAQAALVHRLARGRLGAQGQGRQEEGRARTGRQRGGGGRRGRRPRACARADRVRGVLPVGPELHRGAADPDPRGIVRPASGRCWSRRPGRWSRAIRTTRETFIGPMISEKEAAAAQGVDRRSGGGRARRCSPAAGATGRCWRRRCSRARTQAMQRRPRGSVRPARQPQPKFSDWREALADGQRQQVRPADRAVHPRPAQGARSVGHARGRRRGGQRRVVATGSTTCRTAGSRTSGLGREGVRFAMEDMTEIRNLVIRRV